MLKSDSGSSELSTGVRGGLSLPASLPILKRKAWDVGCLPLPQARGWQQGASSCCIAIQQVPVGYVTALLPQRTGHKPGKTPLLVTVCPLHTPPCSVPGVNTLHPPDFQPPSRHSWVVQCGADTLGLGGGRGHFRFWQGLPPSVEGHSSQRPRSHGSRLP